VIRVEDQLCKSHRRRRNHITESGIDLHRYPRCAQSSDCVEVQSAIFKFLADATDLDGISVEQQAVVGFDGHGEDVPECVGNPLLRCLYEDQEVDVTRRPIAAIHPSREQRRSLEHKGVGVLRSTQPVQQPLAGIARQRELHVLASFSADVLQARQRSTRGDSALACSCRRLDVRAHDARHSQHGRGGEQGIHRPFALAAEFAERCDRHIKPNVFSVAEAICNGACRVGHAHRHAFRASYNNAVRERSTACAHNVQPCVWRTRPTRLSVEHHPNGVRKFVGHAVQLQRAEETDGGVRRALGYLRERRHFAWLGIGKPIDSTRDVFQCSGID